MPTDREPLQHLAPESAYALLAGYFEDTIKPAALHHYLRCESNARLHQKPGEQPTVIYDPLTTGLRSALTDFPAILEAFHQLLRQHHNPFLERAHTPPQRSPLAPIFVAGDPELS